MADLKSILVNDIERTIDGVIKADDRAHIRQEIEEYVITQEVAKHLDKFIEGYRESIEGVRRGENYPYNGVWISGYFGSGKSHLLKMLAYILENSSIGGEPLAELFVPKISDQIQQANMRKVLEVPARSILFNIDQEADARTGSHDNALIYIFEKVFNRFLGYFPYDRNVAQFERHLDDEAIYEKFKKEYEEINGSSWEDSRKTAFSIGRKNSSEYWRKAWISAKTMPGA
ncbi:DUF6079 family protein [Marispirochaeta aestuarii]|uniref:DUF6079 family protein n=1 Tax=Marispirochaeta aestuarii TaxID=1963862 RepID=UPI0029C92857|nr:DUF6079 family protein [Marispirochaeta aestuarii]